MNKQEILDAIGDYIKSNGLQEITGQILNTILTAIAKIIPEETMLTSSFAGIAYPTSNFPVVPGYAKWFIASPGVYPIAGNALSENGKLCILAYDGSNWNILAIELPKASQYILPFESSNFPINGPVQRIYDNNIWQLPDGITSGVNDIPGISGKWKLLGNDYILSKHFIQTGDNPSDQYNISSFRGWSSLKKREKIQSVRYGRIQKRGAPFGSSGNYIIKLWGSNSINQLDTELNSITITANDFNSLKDGDVYNFDFGIQTEITTFKYIAISIEGSVMPPIKHALGSDIEGKGLYKTDSSADWITVSDTLSYGLWWAASEDIVFPIEKKINEAYLPTKITELTKHNLIREIRQVAKFPSADFFKAIILGQNKDIYLTLLGDSITAWQSTFLKAFEGIAEVPAVCERQGFAYRLFKAVGFGNPKYRRFDFGKASLLGQWEDKWSDDSQAFFTEVGNFKTYQYGGLGRPDNIYSAPQYTTEIANEICPIENFDSTTKFRDTAKRCSNSANSSVSFTIPAGYLKGDFIFHAINEGDNCTVTVSGGKLKMNSKQNDWNNSAEASGNTFSTARPVYEDSNDPYGIPLRRIFFKKENINEEITITITKSANTSKWLCYWGATYWSTQSQPTALHLTVTGRGSRRFDELNATKSSDILGVNTDILVLENTLINSMGDRNQVINFRNQYDILRGFLKSKNIPYLLFSPHMTSINAEPENFENSKSFHNGVRGYEIQNGEVVFDVNQAIMDVYESFYKTEYNTVSDFIKTLMFDITTHPNERGFDFYQVACEHILK